MILRTILSVAMLLPALPTKADCGDCPFTSLEECREWLDACCGAGDDVETICGPACVEAMGDEGEAYCSVSCSVAGQSEYSSTLVCCSAVTDEPGVAGCFLESTCSSDNLPCGEAPESLAGTGEPVCLWCVCCPLGRPRPQEPQPAPAVQRPSAEREKTLDDAGSRHMESSSALPTQLVFATPVDSVRTDSRQALLCVWRN